ncbi:Hypothetical protein SMAX5B_007080 [Scophthalmus maximus]|uniref:Uncharacterized protein n=1 Tax=Scophthalmus maximus TaxID=52904 RepID=A0A2U9B0D0_SCOMX|nr:Hypothetical protein SMAX5B_007080 [Scophthalmus maximus]
METCFVPVPRLSSPGYKQSACRDGAVQYGDLRLNPAASVEMDREGFSKSQGVEAAYGAVRRSVTVTRVRGFVWQDEDFTSGPICLGHAIKLV